MKFLVRFEAEPAKYLKKLLDEKLRRRIFATIEALAAEPRPAGAKKMQGWDQAWRVRVGECRIVYVIEEAVLTVVVVRIGHRREVYRGR